MSLAEVSIEQVRAELSRLAPDLSPAGRHLLEDMYCTRMLRGTEQDLVDTDKNVRISIEQGAQMFKIMREHAVSASVEIGFAYGFSTIWILEGLASQARASHTAIDPYERMDWKGVGLAQVDRLSSHVAFDFREEYSIHALSDMIREQKRTQFAFIDGFHRFDDTLVEFYLVDHLLEPGGIVAFDDTWMPSVRAATDFVATNRNYRLKAQPAQNMAVFEKIGDDERPWTHYEPFETRPWPHYEPLVPRKPSLRDLAKKTLRRLRSGK